MLLDNVEGPAVECSVHIHTLIMDITTLLQEWGNGAIKERPMGANFLA